FTDDGGFVLCRPDCRGDLRGERRHHQPRLPERLRAQLRTVMEPAVSAWRLGPKRRKAQPLNFTVLPSAKRLPTKTTNAQTTATTPTITAPTASVMLTSGSGTRPWSIAIKTVRPNDPASKSSKP